jgi:dienelactone hydrolase
LKNAIQFLLSGILILMVAACDRQVQTLAIESEAESTHDAPYAVGSSTLFIHDDSRSYDSVTGVDTGIRTLITEIWYPVDHDTIADGTGHYRRATYGDYVFGDRDMHHLMMTKTTFFHLTPDTVREGVTEAQIDAAIEELFLHERLSYVDAPLAATSEGWPVIVMTHGDAGSRYNMETACEHLAAHGYVVIAPEHTGNSPYSLTGRDPDLAAEGGDPEFRERMAGVLALLSEHGAYGSEDNYGQSYTPLSEGRGSMEFLRYFDQSLLQRLNDLRATLKKLDQMNNEGFAGAGAGVLNLDRVGLMGRSLGGATTLMGLAMEPRFTAGFAVVPPGWADVRSSLSAELLAPPGEESVVLAADGPFPLTDISKPTVLLSGAEDSLIIGLAARSAGTSGTPAPTPANPHALLRQAYETTDAPVVWGLLADSNHSTFGVSGGYWWPALKPNTQARFFDPETEFELIAPAIAHQMQKELALAFFDLTIREDESARTRLLENRYQAEGLTLESRNF